MQINERRGLTRRRFLAGAGVLTAGAVGRAVLRTRRADAAGVPLVALGEQPAGLPLRQHEWNRWLAHDQFGNALPPRFGLLLFFDVKGEATPLHAGLLEGALRELERSYPWGHEGLLFTVGWGPRYFTRVLRIATPIPAPSALSPVEAPSFDRYEVCIHLASDDQRRLATVEHQLTRRLRPALRLRATRSGFAGAGLAAAHQHADGIPSGNPVSQSAPLFMGFKSALTRNQATEDAVTTEDAVLGQYTTMALSHIHLRLDSWYQELSYAQRVARMYSPQTTPEDVADFTTDAESNPAQIYQAIRKHGVVGHAQAAATARFQGKPLILRRDFNTVDGGQAGVHFVSLQRAISDFVWTRNAVNQSAAPLENPAITATVNNGINQFMSVVRRGNYLIPSRADRSFPLLPGRSAVLDSGQDRRV